ncbi:GSU2403 family nucleotidyltransferase fold protein [Paraburkholderia phenazinium]|uniref:GSU2403 family nucleotidyltransferase fold protein n=1 Tax=Paraburkholderia phenazinium TaxID=60549 RepID=UPI001FC8212A|nr:GSU2403 family nucleotidyltransferase fold protein [Paraburkholderia phenazinium]
MTERAGTQARVPLHSPGSAAQKTVDGKTYLYWRVYLASGKHKETSLGRAGEPDTEAALEARLLESAEMRALGADVQVLRKAGFAAADNSSALTIATLFNAGIFGHGGVLVGSHAFGALLNSLGVHLPTNYRTEDIDIGSAGTISVAIPEERSFLDILRDSSLPFLEVPELDSRRPSTSFKARGQPLKVDLLVPGTEAYETRPLPHLRAHATGLPYFKYLVSNPAQGFVLGKEHAIPVMLPDPARFALHKLIVSTLRTASHALKADKDRRQAAVLIDALMEKFPEWLAAASDSLEEAARPRVAVAAARALILAPHLSQRAQDFLEELGAQG